MRFISLEPMMFNAISPLLQVKKYFDVFLWNVDTGIREQKKRFFQSNRLSIV